MSDFNFDLDGATDEDFFGTLKSKSSKLQQLFGDDLPQEEKEQCLKYKRPKATDLKAPKKMETMQQPTTSSHPITLLVKVVTAYKQSELQGKVGLALIKTDEDVSIILYKSKSQVLVTLQLEVSHMKLFKEYKYWQFYDFHQVYWCFSFESQNDEEEFREKLSSVGHEFKENETEKIPNNEEKVSSPHHNIEDTQMEVKSEIDLPQLPSKDTTKESKNAIIKRMAKMGQPLPKLSSNSLQTTTEFSDSSEDTEVINMPLPAKPTIAPRNKVATLKSNHQLVSSTVTFNPNVMESQYMQMLLTEQRTQGTELRMNVSKLENKIEKVLDKLDFMERSGTGESKDKRHKDDEILELEEKILNLKKENRKLKQLTEQRNEQVSYEQRSRDILNEFEEELGDINMGNLKDLRTTLKSCIENIQEKQGSLKELQRKCHESDKLIQEKQAKLEKMHISSEQHLEKLEERDKIIKNYEEEKQKLIFDYEQKIEDLKKELQEKSVKKEPQNSSDAIVKTIMNNLYSEIYDKLETSHINDSDKVLAIVSSSIKQQTLKGLQQAQADESN